MTPVQVFDGQHLRVLHFDRGHNHLMVTFDFRSPGKTDFGPVNESSGFEANGFDQLMIKTRRNDWFINAETRTMESLLGPVTARYERVHALGYSMGGFGAFRFSRALAANVVVAVSPQSAASPDTAPFDRRYASETANLDPKQGLMPGSGGVSGAVVFDPFIPFDRLHASHLKKMFPAIKLVAAPFGGHPASGTLREAGRAGIIQRAAMGLISVERVGHIHRQARATSSGYWSRLAARADQHRPELAEWARTNARQITMKMQEHKCD